MKQQNSVQHDNKQFIDAKDLIRKCISDVTQELKGILPYKNGIEWKICKATSYYGKYSHGRNAISITQYLTDEQDIRNTVAHELIHACGICGHKEQFKQYAEKLKRYGFDVLADLNDGTLMDKVVNTRNYTIKCTHCEFETTRKNKMKIENYRCPRCKSKLTMERI